MLELPNSNWLKWQREVRGSRTRKIPKPAWLESVYSGTLVRILPLSTSRLCLSQLWLHSQVLYPYLPGDKKHLCLTSHPFPPVIPAKFPGWTLIGPAQIMCFSQSQLPWVMGGTIQARSQARIPFPLQVISSGILFLVINPGKLSPVSVTYVTGGPGLLLWLVCWDCWGNSKGILPSQVVWGGTLGHLGSWLNSWPSSPPLLPFL